MEEYQLWSYGILLVGALFFLFFIIRAKRKARGIQHYEDIRDKLTVREEEPEEESEEEMTEEGSGMSLGNLVGGFVTILVGVTLAPEIAKAVEGSMAVNATTEMSAVTETILSITPILFIAGIAMVGIGMALPFFRKMKLI